MVFATRWDCTVGCSGSGCRDSLILYLFRWQPNVFWLPFICFVWIISGKRLELRRIITKLVHLPRYQKSRSFLPHIFPEMPSLTHKPLLLLTWALIYSFYFTFGFQILFPMLFMINSRYVSSNVYFSQVCWRQPHLLVLCCCGTLMAA